MASDSFLFGGDKMQERRFILKAFNDFYKEEHENVLDVFNDILSEFTYTSQLNVAFGFNMLHTFLVKNFAKIDSPEMADGLIFDYMIEMSNHDSIERSKHLIRDYSNKYYCAWYIANEFITYLSSIEMERQHVNDIKDSLIEEGYDEKLVKKW